MNDRQFRIITVLLVLVALLLVALLLVLVLGRGGGGEIAAATTTTTVAPGTTPAPTTTTTAPATTTTVPTTTTTMAVSPTSSSTTTTTIPTCPPAPSLVSGATDVIAVTGDFDGDGVPDDLTTYLDPAAGRRHVRVELAAGGGSDRIIEDADPVMGSRPLGGHDLDGDGRDEAFVVVGSGASAQLVGLYAWSGCTLVRITLDGAPAVFPVGASVTHGEGLSCNGVGELDELRVETTDGITWDGTRIPYQLAGSVLVAGATETFTAGTDEALTVVGVDCSGLVGV